MPTCEELQAQKTSLMAQIATKITALGQAYTDMVLAWSTYAALDTFPGGPLSLPLSTQGLSDRMDALADLLPDSQAALTACEALNEKFQTYITLQNELNSLNAELTTVMTQMFQQNCAP